MPPESRKYSYGRQSISEADIRSVTEALRSDFLTQGPLVGQFEESLCRYTGARYAVAVANGTVALHLAALALGISPGDEAVTSPNTFLASANCVVYCGGNPVFADIEPATANLDPKKIEAKITPNTKAIIPVHFAGHPCDMAAIQKIAKKHRLKVIEDAAHAIGSDYKDSKVGSCRYSDLTTFSFHPVKTITTGEGGAITTNDNELYEKLLMLRSHGMTKNPKRLKKNDGPWYYEMQTLGYNGRITDLQAALGLSQLKRLETFKKKRRKLVEAYRKLFDNDERFAMLEEKTYSNACFHLCPLLLNFEVVKKTKKEIFASLAERGIHLQVHYIPVHTQPFYQARGFKDGDFPHAEEYYRRTMSLPLYADLSVSDTRYIARTIKEVVR